MDAFKAVVAIGVGLVLLLLAGCNNPRSVAGSTSARPSGAATAVPAHVLAPTAIAEGLAEAHKALGYATEVETYAPGCLAQALAETKAEIALAPDGAELRAAALSAKGSDPVGRLLVVLAVRRGNPLKIKAVGDLGRDEVRVIAAASPDADSAAALFGEAAAAAGLGDQVGSKLATSVSSEDALTAVAREEAQAAVAYLPQVMFGDCKDDCGIGAFLPKEGEHAVDLLAAAIGSGHESMVSSYVRALRTRSAQDALARFAVEPVVPRAPGEADVSLLVPCGAGLQPAMDAIGAAYLQRTGVRVDFSYAGSGMLMAQLDFTHSGDLYMPGEAFWVTLAERKGLVNDTRPVVYFTPVLAVPQGNPGNIRGLEDLARPGVRVALGDPKALAIGPVTKRILERAGIWQSVQGNVVMYGGCIPELASCIAMKGADVGVLWDAVALQHRDKVDTVDIAPDQNEAAEVMLATLTCATYPEAAKSFLDFVASDEASALFEQNGFRTEPPPGIRLAPREGPDA